LNLFLCQPTFRANPPQRKAEDPGLKPGFNEVSLRPLRALRETLLNLTLLQENKNVLAQRRQVAKKD
jgi:hypothetical protein